MWLYSESMIRCWDCIVYSKSVIRYRNWVVCNELTFAAESVSAVVNQRLLLKVCVLQWICDSLSKVCWLQRINVHCWKCVVCSESAFAVERVLPVANQRWLSKGCCVQRISVCCRKGVVCSKSMIRCWNWVICSESTFIVESVCFVANLWLAAEIELSAAN
jgi:hypothetical protein